jgi:RNA polymerase-binding transcription factor DksA
MPRRSSRESRLGEGDLTRLRQRLIADCALEAAHARNGAVIEIFNALLRIDAGVYGMCCDCGNSLNVAALDANPRESCCSQCRAARDGPPSRTHVPRSE